MNEISPALFYAIVATLLGFTSLYFSIKVSRKSDDAYVESHYPGYRKYGNIYHYLCLWLLEMRYNAAHHGRRWDNMPYLYMFKFLGATYLVNSNDAPGRFEWFVHPILYGYSWLRGTYIEFDGAAGKGSIIILTSWAHPTPSRPTVFLYNGTINMYLVVNEYLKCVYDAQASAEK